MVCDSKGAFPKYAWITLMCLMRNQTSVTITKKERTLDTNHSLLKPRSEVMKPQLNTTMDFLISTEKGPVLVVCIRLIM